MKKDKPMEYIAITGFQRIMENSEKLVGIKAEIMDFSRSMPGVAPARTKVMVMGTIKILKILTPVKFAVIILKFEPGGFAIE